MSVPGSRCSFNNCLTLTGLEGHRDVHPWLICPICCNIMVTSLRCHLEHHELGDASKNITLCHNLWSEGHVLLKLTSICVRYNIDWEMHRLLWSMGMKRVSIFGIWRENSPLPLPTFHANCWRIKRNCWQNILRQYDFRPFELHEKILTLLGKSSFFGKINCSYNRHNVSAAIWDQKFLSKSDLYCLDRLHLGVKIKVLFVASTWCIRFWHTIYRHQTMTQILESAYH